MSFNFGIIFAVICIVGLLMVILYKPYWLLMKKQEIANHYKRYQWYGNTRKWLTKKTKMILCMLSAIFFAQLIWTIWANTALTVSNIKISSNRIPTAFSGFRITQISDLHNAEFGKGNKKLLELLSESNPDIIVITGDFVDSGHTDFNVALDFAKGAVNIAPVYYVTGNHEASLSQVTIHSHFNF